jgi:hypothetical protein
VEHLFDEKDVIYAKVLLGQVVPRRRQKRSGVVAVHPKSGLLSVTDAVFGTGGAYDAQRARVAKNPEQRVQG